MTNNITLPHDWAPRDYQLPVLQYLDGGGRYAVCVWHRRARSRLVGQPKALSKKDLKPVKTMMANGKNSVSEIADQFGVNRSTLYRNLDA